MLAQGLLCIMPYSGAAPSRGSDILSQLANQREGQLIEEIAVLYRRVSDGPAADSVRTRCARAYLRELLRFKHAGNGAPSCTDWRRDAAAAIRIRFVTCP
jgi:hypothetical protein